MPPPKKKPIFAHLQLDQVNLKAAISIYSSTAEHMNEAESHICSVSNMKLLH